MDDLPVSEYEYSKFLEIKPNTGVYAWYLGGERLCDHEHDEFDTYMCEDARTEASTRRARR